MKKKFHAQREDGLAFVEFAISLPFLVFMFIAIIDVGLALNQYMMLRDVVHQVVRGAASGATDPASSYCQTSGIPPSQAIDEQVVGLIDDQNLKLKSQSICVSSGISGSEVFVEASGNYDGLFPIFDSIRISARASSPRLF